MALVAEDEMRVNERGRSFAGQEQYRRQVARCVEEDSSAEIRKLKGSGNTVTDELLEGRGTATEYGVLMETVVRGRAERFNHPS